MADSWFEIASIDHFWIRRRFQVLRCLADDLIAGSQNLAEIGCGHGLLQAQMENVFARPVTGFDLNDAALRRNISRMSDVVCYDISERDDRLGKRFDLVFLFDVLEHIADEDAFIQAVLFHLRDSGALLINVPAGQWLFSDYDAAAGHVRRYSTERLRQVALRNGMMMTRWTYWGFPFLPTLMIRKLWMAGKHGEAEVISAGFDPRNPFFDRCLSLLGKCELIPQHVLGTSLMAVLCLSSTRA